MHEELKTNNIITAEATPEVPHSGINSPYEDKEGQTKPKSEADIINDDKDARDKQNKAKKNITIFASVVALLALSYGAYWWFYASHFEETENAYVSADQNSVTSQVAATVTELNIQDGKRMKSGDIALRLDTTDYRVNLTKAEADLATAVRNYYTLQLNRSQSKDTLAQRMSDLKKARDDFTRDKAAYNAGIISQEAYTNSEHAYENASLSVGAATSQYNNTVVQATSASVYAHPDVQKAINAYRQAYIDYTRTQVRVPVNGVVAKRNVYIGQKVAPNQELFSVVNLDNEWVDANLKESQLKKLQVGQHVELKSDVNGKTYRGYVTSVGAGSGSALSLLPAQNATGNWIKIVQRVPVRIDLDKKSLQENGTIPAGTSMRVSVDTQSKPVQEDKLPKIEEQKTSIYTVDEQAIKNKVDAIVANNQINFKK